MNGQYCYEISLMHFIYIVVIIVSLIYLFNINIIYFKPKDKTVGNKKYIVYKVICHFLNKINTTTRCRITEYNGRYYPERKFKNFLFKFYYVIGNREGFKEKIHAIEEINHINGVHNEKIPLQNHYLPSGSTHNY